MKPELKWEPRNEGGQQSIPKIFFIKQYRRGGSLRTRLFRFTSNNPAGYQLESICDGMRDAKQVAERIYQEQP